MLCSFHGSNAFCIVCPSCCESPVVFNSQSVENVNLGQIYRSQFEAAARRYNGDIDQVIDNWEEQSTTDA